MYGYLSEHHSFGETEEVAGEYAKSGAGDAGDGTLNVEFDPTCRGTRKKEVYPVFRKQDCADDEIHAVGGGGQARVVEHRAGRRAY